MAQPGGAECVFVDAPALAAIGQDSVDGDRRHRLDAKGLCLLGDGGIVHAQHRHLARRARDLIDLGHGGVANRATGAENLYLAFVGPGFVSFL